MLFLTLMNNQGRITKICTPKAKMVSVTWGYSVDLVATKTPRDQ